MSETPFIFKKKGGRRPQALRQKDTETADENDSTQVVNIVRKKTVNPLVQSTGRRKRLADELSDVSSDEGEADFAVRHSAATQRPRRDSQSPPAEAGMGASSSKATEDSPEMDGIYRGAAKVAHQLPKAFGPLKSGPSNVRTITVVDYQPDVCKDYKETGFCGFGDTCKFLHDRGDYLHGWQLDNQFLSDTSQAFMAKQAQRGATQADADSDEEEELPFACLICRKPFGTDPVVTLCGHYFDAACAVKRFAKTGKCLACGKPTNGVFNKATKLIKVMKERDALKAKAGDLESESDDGFEIQGLKDATEEAPEEPEPPRPPRKRPIIEYEG